jgi:hypothetical protein
MANISGGSTSGMTDVFAYFSDKKTNGFTLSQFAKEWRQLSEQDKEDLKSGVTDGTLNY